MKHIAVLSMLLIAQSSFASGPSFQAQVEHLHTGQLGIEQALRGMSRSVGVPYGEPETKTQEAPRPLFQIHDSLSRVRIGSDKLLFGVLVNRLVVGADGSPAFIDLDGSQGSVSRLRVVGIARQSGTEGRVGIEFNRLLIVGKTIPIQALALDPEGAFGLEAQVFSHKAWAVAGAIASSFISGLSAAQQTEVSPVPGFSQVQPTGRNAMLQGVSQSAADQSKRMIEESTADKPILVVEAGAAVTVLIQEEVKW